MCFLLQTAVWIIWCLTVSVIIYTNWTEQKWWMSIFQWNHHQFLLQISPFILNTVMTITAAMTTKQRNEQSQEVKSGIGDLWSVMNIYECNHWFLGVDEATEVTESFREQDRSNKDENFAAQVKVWHFIITEQDFIFKGQICFLLTRSCCSTGGPGDSGVWCGSSNSTSAAGRVLLKCISQKLVISSAPESWHDTGGKSWSFWTNLSLTPETEAVLKTWTCPLTLNLYLTFRPESVHYNWS